MKSSFLRLLTTAAVALAITSVTSFAAETEKKKEDEKSPCCPTEAPKSQITNHCGKCEKKDEPATTPATEPAKTEPVKSEISSHCGGCEKKDGEKCPPAPTEAPKA
jgi:hypothetical protein